MQPVIVLLVCLVWWLCVCVCVCVCVEEADDYITARRRARQGQGEQQQQQQQQQQQATRHSDVMRSGGRLPVVLGCVKENFFLFQLVL